MKVKTSELIGPALDWAVTKCEGFLCDYQYNGALVSYSTNWTQGGPIIEREGIDLYCNVPTNPNHKDVSWRGSWRARYCRCGYGTEFSYGPTSLIAAMRTLVASKLGDEVEIPEELLP